MLLTVAWTHGCIGIYFWVRLKAFYRWAAPLLLTVAVLLPPLAMLGLIQGARETIRLSADPEWRRTNIMPIPPAQRDVLDEIVWVYFPIGYLTALGLVFAARGARSLRERRGGAITLSYPDREVRG